MNGGAYNPDETYKGNIDTSSDGHIGSGTGDQADDTAMGNNGTNKHDAGEGPVESVVDGAMNGAANAVDDVTDAATGGMGVWGIVIVVIIIAAIAILIYFFFAKRK